MRRALVINLGLALLLAIGYWWLKNPACLFFAGFCSGIAAAAALER